MKKRYRNLLLTERKAPICIDGKAATPVRLRNLLKSHIAKKVYFEKVLQKRKRNQIVWREAYGKEGGGGKKLPRVCKHVEKGMFPFEKGQGEEFRGKYSFPEATLKRTGRVN